MTLVLWVNLCRICQETFRRAWWCSRDSRRRSRRCTTFAPSSGDGWFPPSASKQGKFCKTSIVILTNSFGYFASYCNFLLFLSRFTLNFLIKKNFRCNTNSSTKLYLYLWSRFIFPSVHSNWLKSTLITQSSVGKILETALILSCFPSNILGCDEHFNLQRCSS